MRTDKLTSKFQLPLSDAQSLAVGRDHQFIEPTHLMLALLNQEGGTVRPLLAQAGVDVNQLRSGVGEAAATLSHRYITDRQLPDKAIDLIDEGASHLRMEIDSMPEEMDRLDRRLIQLKIEQEALKKEKDKASQKRLSDLKEEISRLEREFSDLEEVWKAEKAAIQGTTHIKEALDRARVELDVARRANDLTRMSELTYGTIPDLEKQLEMATQVENQEMRLLKTRVTEEEIAQVVAKWTGIPVSKLLEGEREKLLHMEEALHQRVVGQDEAVSVVTSAIQHSRAGFSDPNRPNGSFLFLGPTGVGKTELCKALAEFLFDTEGAMVRVDMKKADT